MYAVGGVPSGNALATGIGCSFIILVSVRLHERKLPYLFRGAAVRHD